MYAYSRMFGTFSQASQDADEAYPDPFFICGQYGTNPDVPSDGLDIPCPCRCFALGVLHGNLRIAKVAMLAWGIIHSGAYCLEPDPHILLKYKNFKMLQSLEWKSNAWNATVLSLPFGGMLFALGFRTEEVLFILSFEMAFILYLQGMTLFRWVCSADIGRVMIQVAIFIPLFVASCFIPYLNLVWLMLIGMFSYVVYVKWSTVWR